jgi:hypothetical protein
MGLVWMRRGLFGISKMHNLKAKRFISGVIPAAKAAERRK